MITRNSIGSMLVAAMLPGVMVGGLAHGQVAAGNIEMMELKTSLEASAKRILVLESQVVAQQAQTSALTANLASANAQTTHAREQYERLRAVVEGLGVGALSGSTDEVQARLLAALADLHLLDVQKKQLTESLLGVSEAAMVYAKAAPTADVAVQTQLQEKLTVAGKAVASAQGDGTGDARAQDLHNAQVVSTKSEGGIAVFNVGSRDGVRVGMPFQVFRGDKAIARALVVDVRKNVCGAIVQELMGADNAVKTGDRGEVDPTRTF